MTLLEGLRCILTLFSAEFAVWSLFCIRSDMSSTVYNVRNWTNWNVIWTIQSCQNFSLLFLRIPVIYFLHSHVARMARPIRLSGWSTTAALWPLWNPLEVGTEQHSCTRSSMWRYQEIRYDMIWYDMIWYDMIWWDQKISIALSSWPWIQSARKQKNILTSVGSLQRSIHRWSCSCTGVALDNYFIYWLNKAGTAQAPLCSWAFWAFDQVWDIRCDSCVHIDTVHEQAGTLNRGLQYGTVSCWGDSCSFVLLTSSDTFSLRNFCPNALKAAGLWPAAQDIWRQMAIKTMEQPEQPLHLVYKLQTSTDGVSSTLSDCPSFLGVFYQGRLGLLHWGAKLAECFIGNSGLATERCFDTFCLMFDLHSVTSVVCPDASQQCAEMLWSLPWSRFKQTKRKLVSACAT